MRIVLADDQPGVRSALRLRLEHEPGFEVCGEVAGSGELLAQLDRTRPDLLLIDWELPGRPPDELLPLLRCLWPDLKVVAMSGRGEARRASQAAGVDGFVSKGDPTERLVAILKSLDRPRP